MCALKCVHNVAVAFYDEITIALKFLQTAYRSTKMPSPLLQYATLVLT